MTVPGFLWPLRSTDFRRANWTGPEYTIRVTIDGVTEDVAVPGGVGFLQDDTDIWFSGDGEVTGSGGGSAGDMAKILFDALALHSNGADVNSVEIGTDPGQLDTQFLSIDCDTDLALLWAHANTTVNALPFGFDQSNTTPSHVTTSTRATWGSWLPNAFPSNDSKDRLQVISASATALSGAMRTSRIAEQLATRQLSFTLLHESLALNELADEPLSRPTAEDMIRYAMSYGRNVRYYDDIEAARVSGSGYTLYKLNADKLELVMDSVRRDDRFRLRWQVDLPLRRVG